MNIICRLMSFAFWVLAMATSSAWAESAASKNKQGNALFSQGQYQEAEKAYLDARSASPARPELEYNLGNSLIKQKKYAPALNSLRQAASKGDAKLQQSSWFNMGDALYEMGDYDAAAQAFVRALKLNPGDRDAKHNLELALRAHQQKQSSSGEGGNKQQQKSAASGQVPETEKKRSNKKDISNEVKPSDVQSSQAAPKNDSLSRERALQILDAFRNQELADQRKLLQHPERRKATGKDW